MSDLIALAEQCGADSFTGDMARIVFCPHELQAFADLIRQDERENIAFEEYSRLSQSINESLDNYHNDQTHAPELDALADRAIRANTAI